jgi:catechol 2,3-dioxygenase-like lactoylglutathione lyase family enzyme
VRGRSAGLWWGTAIEAPDPKALAAFYTKLLDWPLVHEEPGTAVLKPPQDSVYMVFQRAEDYVAPRWPPEPGRQRTMMHLDIQVTNLDDAVEDAVALGARVADAQPRENVRVLLDPAGHPFCLCRDEDG